MSNETWMPAVPSPARRDRLFDDRRDALAIDVLHREHVDARVADGDLLALVEVADADEDGLRRQHLGRRAADARQLGRLGAEQRRERHAVDVAAQRCRGRVHVAVRVDPQQADRQLLRRPRPTPPRPRPTRRPGCGRRRARAAARRLASDASAALVQQLAHAARCRRCTSSARPTAPAFRESAPADRPCRRRGSRGRRGARRGRQSEAPTAPCPRRGGCRRDRAARR